MLTIKDCDNIVHLDFESYYDRDYSLTKLPTVLYVRDERFKVFGCAVALNDEPSVYLTDSDLDDWLASVDWANTAVSAYNCAFDACVLTQHYGYVPKFYIDPMSVARALLPIDRVPLKAVAPLLGLGDKGNALVEGAKTAGADMADYACNDNELCRGIYNMLYPLISETEQYHIHMHIRQAVEPMLVLDQDVLTQVRDDEVARRNALIEASGYTEKALSSNAQFARIVEGLGLTCPVKLSPTTGEETTAFSKGDDEWVEFTLAYPQHKAIWDARMAAKSTINVTRAERFLTIATTGAGTMPMPLNYCGAHTGRSSGADKLNVQNLPNKYKSNLRKAIKAPKGQVIVVVDSAQIELRVNMWLAGERGKLDLLASGGDIYIDEASAQFSIDPADVTKTQRQYGKLCIAEGEPVLTNKGLVPIEKITTRHLVWDGVSFVHHDGVIYKGISEVITHDGLTATPDHRVWAEGHRNPISMRYAAQTMARLIRTGDGRTPIRYVGGNRQQVQPGREVSKNSLPMRLWNAAIGGLEKLILREDQRLFMSIDTGRLVPTQMAAEGGYATGCGTSKMSEPGQQGILQLRGAGDSVQVRFNARSSGMGIGESRGARRQNGAGSNRQQWSLRTGELTMGDADGTDAESPDDVLFDVSWEKSGYATMALALLVRGYCKVRKIWDDWRGGYPNCAFSRDSETQRMEGDTTAPKRARVYDILNAGPNHRFTVTNQLVSNCQLGLGYGMGATKFMKTAASGPLGMQPIYITLEQAYATVQTYRANNSGVPALWRRLDSRIHQMTLPGLRETEDCLTFVHDGIELPSGRMLQYPGLCQNDDGSWVYGVDKKIKFLWGGTMDENICQALARDIVFEQMLTIDQRYRVVSSTHDEVLFLANESEADEALAFGLEVMSRSPAWALDLPLSAEGGYADNYSK